MNSVSFAIRIASDISYVPAGVRPAYATFRAVHGTGDNAMFMSAQCHGSTADSVAKWGFRGRQAAISGRLSIRKWKGEDGEHRIDLTVTVTSLTLMGAHREAVVDAHATGLKRLEGESPEPAMPS